jgi:hypothetical protein
MTNEKKSEIKEIPPKQPDATSPTEALSDAIKPTELDNKDKQKKTNDTR